MKKSLLVVIALLAIASLMAAMAYTSATVSSKASLVISTTEDSILAFNVDPSRPGHEDGNAVIENNNLVLKFNNDIHGMQQGSTYNWDQMFSITNNSNSAVRVTAKWGNGDSQYSTLI